MVLHVAVLPGMESTVFGYVTVTTCLIHIIGQEMLPREYIGVTSMYGCLLTQRYLYSQGDDSEPAALNECVFLLRGIRHSSSVYCLSVYNNGLW
jgi:hypothetical protein